MKTTLSLRDAGLALAVVAVWGTNFVVIKVALATLPPLLLATLRFTLVLLPAVFFLPRPRVGWSNLALYGFAIGLGQFGMLFLAMNGLISPGLASLVVQMQVFFTIALSVWRGGERIAAHQIAAFVLAVAGMGVIAVHNGHGTTVTGLVLTLLAGLGWAVGNQTAREAAQRTHVNMLAYVVWASLFSVPPLAALSLLVEGWPTIVRSVVHAPPAVWVAVAWQSVGNTLFGYTVWNWLLSRYPAATVTPTSLLVPVFGIGASALLLGESLQGWKMAASAAVMAGLAVNLLWPKTRNAGVLPSADKDIVEPAGMEDTASAAKPSP
ncbi:MAG TPA: EamA family transporter [Rhizomicrobium sp.]|jgi:O-acetylserine/cysteine efflux transporter|nr:EamA family transporter [Rhizomicrobium sp.]